MIFSTACGNRGVNRLLTDRLKETIALRYHLPREGPDWLLAKGIRLRSPHRHSLGFSLDNARKPPLAFFSGSPPPDLAKMCDAILALDDKEGLYLFIVEQKTADSGDYDKQLANGRLFCEWLISLYRQHGYCSKQQRIEFIGLLVWEPRPTPRKGSTSHQPYEPAKRTGFPRFFNLRNESLIQLRDLIGEK